MELLLALLEGTPSVGPSGPETDGRTGTTNIAASMTTTLDIRSVKKRLGRLYRRYVRSLLPDLIRRNRVAPGVDEKTRAWLSGCLCCSVFGS